MTARAGVVYLVGAGPGDPGLITVRGLELLETADVVVYDRLVDERLLRRARVDAEMVDAGKTPGGRGASQGDIDALLIARASEGRSVVRLKGGDPFVFGRGGEEAMALSRAGIPFEVVPGITSAIAAPAYAGIPVTHRGIASSVTFVTGSESPDKPGASVDWSALGANQRHTGSADGLAFARVGGRRAARRWAVRSHTRSPRRVGNGAAPTHRRWHPRGRRREGPR